MSATCRETGKIRFRTHKAASEALARCTFMRRRQGKVYRMERSVYLCAHCDCWHLSSWAR